MNWVDRINRIENVKQMNYTTVTTKTLNTDPLLIDRSLSNTLSDLRVSGHQTTQLVAPRSGEELNTAEARWR